VERRGGKGVRKSCIFSKLPSPPNLSILYCKALLLSPPQSPHSHHIHITDDGKLQNAKRECVVSSGILFIKINQPIQKLLWTNEHLDTLHNEENTLIIRYQFVTVTFYTVMFVTDETQYIKQNLKACL
jgi:hypothetical protein